MKFLLIIFLLLKTLPSLAYSEVVMTEQGEILHSYNAETRIFPASLRKLMTIYFTFEALQEGRLAFKQKLFTTKRAASQSRINLGLKYGDLIAVEKALDGVIQKYANDATIVLEEFFAPNRWIYTEMLNQRALQLGLYNTNFGDNYSGNFGNRGGKYTTLIDMAKFAFIIKNDFPIFFDLFAKTEFKFNGTKFFSRNNILKKTAFATGLKDGYSKESGYYMITTAHYNDKYLAIGIAGADRPGRAEAQMIKLIERFLRNAPNDITEYAEEMSKKPFPWIKK